MDYKKHYDLLIKQARLKLVTGDPVYLENHHIIPKCIGGTDEPENLVYLLPEEHYIAHLLLVKIYPNESGLIYAAHMMANRNNKSYGWIKRKFAIQNSIDQTGMKHTVEAKKKMKDAIAVRWNGNREGFIEEQRRRASRPKNKKDGYFQPKSEEHAKNISAAAKQRPRFECDVCGKMITKANIENHKKAHNVIQCI